MKRWIATLTLLTLTITAAAMSARTGNSVAERALSANRGQSDAAIVELRASGQRGVDAFVAASAALVDQSNPRDVAQFRAVLDRICRQRDCYASHLYWYTDLAKAEAAARAEAKPILSLRLLGNLDDDLSCANSRFFRTTLYANAKIAHMLHDQFVLPTSATAARSAARSRATALTTCSMPMAPRWMCCPASTRPTRFSRSSPRCGRSRCVTQRPAPSIAISCWVNTMEISSSESGGGAMPSLREAA